MYIPSASLLDRSEKVYLVVADPYVLVCHSKIDDMVREGLALLVALGGRKHVRQHLLHQLPVRLLIKHLQP